MGLRTWLIKTLIASKQRRGYDAGRMNRLTADFLGSSGSADAIIRGNIAAVRKRTRELCRNNPYGAQARRTTIINVVGPTGIRLRSRIFKADGETLDERRNKLVEQAWNAWQRPDCCHVGGMLSFHGIQVMAVGSLPDTGEILIRLVRRSFGRSRVPLALELIESDQLDEAYTGVSERPGHQWRLGVESDEWGRPTRYAILRRHPGDAELRTHAANEKHEFVDARDIIHFFVPERVGQSRGMPGLTAVATTAHSLGKYEEAHWTRKRVQAASLGWITTPEGELPGDQTINGQRLFDTEPGTYNVLDPGQTVIPPDFGPDDGQYDNVVRNLLRRFAAGFGCSYETLSRDFSQTNYSSSRLSILEDRDHWRLLQSMLVQQLHQRVYEAWFEAAVLSGVLPAQTFGDFWVNPDRYLTPRWQARTWAWVDPGKELDAIKTARELQLDTEENQIQDYSGEQFDEVMAQIRKEQDKRIALGLNVNPSLTSSQGSANASPTSTGQGG